MKIAVLAKPRSKKAYVKKVDATNYIVAVKELPIAGSANEAIIKALVAFFHIPASSVFLVLGQAAKQKIFEVPLTKTQLEQAGESQLKMID